MGEEKELKKGQRKREMSWKDGSNNSLESSVSFECPQATVDFSQGILQCKNHHRPSIPAKGHFAMCLLYLTLSS